MNPLAATRRPVARPGGLLLVQNEGCTRRAVTRVSAQLSTRSPQQGVKCLAGGKVSGLRRNSNALGPVPLWRPVPVRPGRREKAIVQAGVDPLVPLGYDFLTFLAATVLVVPLFKRAKVSPVLGYLFVGVVLNQLGYVACTIPAYASLVHLTADTAIHCCGHTAKCLFLMMTICAGFSVVWRRLRNLASWECCFCCLRWAWSFPLTG